MNAIILGVAHHGEAWAWDWLRNPVVRVVIAVAVGLIALGTAHRLDGPVEWLVTSFVVVIGGLLLDPGAHTRLKAFGTIAIVLAVTATVAIGILRLDLAARDDHGTLARPPITGGSDQINFTAMAYTFYRYSVPGIGSGADVGEPILDWAAERDAEGALLERWQRVADGAAGAKTYSYRPHFYPVFLGSVFKVTGYDPALGPVVNAVLYGLTAATLLVFLAHWASAFAGYVGAALFMTIRIVQVWAFQNMPETLVMLLVVLFVAALFRMFAAEAPSLYRWAVIVGVLGGVLALTKQIFLVVGVIVGAGLLIWALFRRRRLLRSIFVVGATTVIVLLPWFGYNLAGTARSDLLLGTEGWHDLPWAYSQEYLDGENRFEIREQIFAKYEADTGQPVRGDIQRAIVGREIFLENLRAGEYWSRVPALVVHKLSEAISHARFSDQLMRLTALLGLVLLGIGWTQVEDREATAVTLALLLAAPFIVVAIDFPDLGRLVMSAWIPTVILAALALSALVNNASDRIRAGLAPVDADGCAVVAST